MKTCTSTVKNFSKHVSVDTDIIYWKNTGRYMNTQYVGHQCKHMKIMKYIYQKLTDCSIDTLQVLLQNVMNEEVPLLV